jgi:hypothetical protein
MLARMRAFGRMSEKQKQMLRLCARLMPESELTGMENMFTSTNKDSSVCLGELLSALKKQGAHARRRQRRCGAGVGRRTDKAAV